MSAVLSVTGQSGIARHICETAHDPRWGNFVIGRKTIKKRMRAMMLAIKIELRKKMHDPHRENRRLDETDAARASELLRSLGL